MLCFTSLNSIDTKLSDALPLLLKNIIGILQVAKDIILFLASFAFLISESYNFVAAGFNSEPKFVIL